MSNIFRDSKSLGKSNGKKWSNIWTFLFGSVLKLPRKKKLFFFADFALVHPPMASVLLSASVERCFVSRRRDFLQKCFFFAFNLGEFYCFWFRQVFFRNCVLLGNTTLTRTSEISCSLRVQSRGKLEGHRSGPKFGAPSTSVYSRAVTPLSRHMCRASGKAYIEYVSENVQDK